MNHHPQSKSVFWDRIRNPQCDACILHEQTKTVCLTGDGPVPCDGMVVGEAPGYTEDEKEIPFCGKSGIFLRECLKEIGLDPKTLFFTNTVACRPPANRTPTSKEIKTCSALYLVPQIAAVKPRAILLLGNSAVLFAKGRKSAVTKLEGTTFSYNGITCVPCRHPASVTRLYGEGIYGFAVQSFKEQLSLFKRTLFPTEDRMKFSRVPFELDEKTPYFYTDIETNGLNPFREDSKIWSAAICQDPEKSMCFALDLKSRNSFVKKCLTDYPIIAHRTTFEGMWFKRKYSITPRIYHDTRLCAFLKNENEPAGLKYQAIKLLGVEPWSEDIDFQNPDFLKMLPYNNRDTVYGMRLYREKDIPWLREHPKVARLMRYALLPFIEVLIDIICNGFHIDEKEAKKKLKLCEIKMAELNSKIDEIAGRKINPGSSLQMRKLLYEDLGLECPVFTKSSKKFPEGNPSTGEPALIRLRGKHEIVEIQLEWRKYQKYKSTYLLPWITKGPILHGNYDPTGTETGRKSSSMVKNKRGEKGAGATLHQCPRDPFIRNLITPRNEDWCLLAGDLSQVQLRLVADAANEPTMIEIFHKDSSKPEGDIHYQTATSLTDAEITKEIRKRAKAVNFGFVFGMFDKKFVSYALENFDLKLTQKEGRDYRRAFFEKYEGLEPWHRRVEAFVSQNGWIDSRMGRRRNLPEARYESGLDEWKRREYIRQGINSPIQADESALIDFIGALLSSYSLPWKAKLRRDKTLPVGTSHDSLLWECHRDYAAEAKQIIAYTIEKLPELLMHYFKVRFRVPILMDVNVYEKCWEGKTLNV